MRQFKYPIILLFALLMHVIPAESQDNRTMDTKVADFLARMPANNEKQLNRQMDLLLELEEEGMQKVLDMVIPPGSGDDTRARFAIESLSRFLSQTGKKEQRIAWEGLLLAEIDNTEDPDVKSFLISQLNYIGGNESVEYLSKYLTDDKLYDPAIRVMRDANPEAAAKIFADHLQKASGNPQIALVNAIGEAGSVQYAPEIATLAGSTDPELQRSVLACLAELGDPGSYGLMMDAAKNAAFMPEPTNATGSLLRFARTLSENEDHQLSLKVCKTVSKKCREPEQIHFKTTALLTAAGNDKIENSVSLLTDAMKSDNRQYRMAAINYAAKNNSPIPPWTATLERTKCKEVKSEILFLFGLLKAKEASDVVKGYLDDADAGVRQQAVLSLALIRQDQALGDILDHAVSYPNEPDISAVKLALLQLVNEDNVNQLVEKMKDAPEGAKVILLEVIAAKGNSGHFVVIYDQIKSEGPARAAALENLHRVASYKDLDELLDLFDRLEDEVEIGHIEKALIASVNSSEDKTRAEEKIIAYASGNSSTDKFIGVFAGIGSEEALKTVYAQYESGNPVTRETAFNALVNWSDQTVCTALFQICSGNNAKEDQVEAFRAYIRFVSMSAQTNDQKLLLLRKIEPLAPDLQAKRQLVRAAGNVNTFLSFVFVSNYLDDEELKADAANSLVKIVLPPEGQDKGLSGTMVREYLGKAKDIISGGESEYIKIDIGNYLEEMPENEGFVSMFNGLDLTGWQGLPADPVAKKGLPEKKLKTLQAEANIKMRDNWSVKDNCIFFNGKGANLCSVKEYGSFEMIVDWRISKNGDSGIYLRGSPQIQIWDTSRVKVGAPVGSGGLYNNKKHESKPLVVADNPVGDWNTFRISMIGSRVTVYLNGQLVVDNVVMENYWDRTIPIFPAGSIELQAHGTDLAFRDIYIYELQSTGYNLSEEEKSEEFVALFNGKDMSGWIDSNHNYVVEDGIMVMRPQGRGGNIFTEKQYSDFIYRFDFKLTPGANNGLGIRAPITGNAAYMGMELQILDNTADVYANLKPYQYHGSVYGIIPAKRGFLNPVGEWNSQEVIMKGDDIKIILNGTIIVDGNLREAVINGTADGKSHPGLERRSGHIGYLGHGSVVWFRNIRIKEL